MRALVLAVVAGCTVTTEVGEELLDPRELQDNDGDGFSPSQNDCDDGDARVAPNLEEVCDGKDTDCDGQGDYPALCERYEVFEQRVELDVLFVMDRSSGMAGVQRRVIDAADLFVGRLGEEEGESRVGVAAADREGALEFAYGYAWAEPPMSSEAMIDWLQAALDLGEEGATARPRDALASSMPDAFHRAGSHLMVVLVSVEDDVHSSLDVDDVLGVLDTWKGPGKVSIHGVVPGAACVDGAAESHEQLVLRTAGTLVDVCDPDEDIGGSLATAVQATAADALTTVFPLAETPQEGSVVVQVQEPGAMPAPWTLGFQVFTDPPRVVLADAPPKGSVIEIGYELDVGD